MTRLADDYVDMVRLFMRAEEVSQRELARRLRVTEARVSQLLNEPGNLTITTMERVAEVLGFEIQVGFKKRNAR